MTQDIGVRAILDDAEFQAGLRNYMDGLNDMQSQTSSMASSASASFASLGGALVTAFAVAAPIAAIGALGAAIGAITYNVTDLAYQIDTASKQAAASLGLMPEEAEKFDAVITEVYRNNFGDSIDDVGSSVTAVTMEMQKLGQVSTSEIQTATQNAIAMRDAFGVDVTEGIATATEMVRSGLVPDIQTAQDILAKGFQSGLGEGLTDSFNEYSVQLAQLGFDGQQALSLIESGYAGTILNSDKALDAAKEFGALFAEGGDEFRAAFESMGLSYDEFAARINSGELSVGDAFNEAIGIVQQMPGEIDKSRAAVALFGTQGGDATAALIEGLSTTSVTMDEITGSTGRLNTQYDTLGGAFEAVKRRAMTALLPIGNALLEIANQIMPHIMAAFDALEPILANVASGVAMLFGDMTSTLAGVASEASEWGYNIGASLADGIGMAMDLVVSMMNEIGSMMEYWLAPGSPPRVAPNLDKWGEAAFGEFIGKFGEGDFGAFNKMSDEIEKALQGAVDAGDMEQADLIPALLGSRAGLSEALAELRETGDVSEATMEKIRKSAGPAADTVDQLINGYLGLQKAANATEEAQSELTDANKEIGKAQRMLATAMTKEEEQKAIAALEAAYARQEEAAANLEVAKAAEKSAQQKVSAEEQVRKVQQDNQKLMQDQQKLLEREASDGPVKQAEEIEKRKTDVAKRGSAARMSAMGNEGKQAERLAKQQEMEAKKAEKAQLQYLLSIGDTEGALKILQGQLAGVEEGSAEYYSILTQIGRIEEKQRKEAEGGGKQGGFAFAGGFAEGTREGMGKLDPFAGLRESAEEVDGVVDDIGKRFEAATEWTKPIRTAMSTIGETIRKFTDPIVKFLRDNWESVAGGIAGALAGVAVAIGGPMITGALTAAVSVIGGILTAILSPVGLLISGFALLGAAIAGNWFGIRDTIVGVWTDTIQPALASLASWIGEQIPPLLQRFSDFWSNTLYPVLQSVGAFIFGALGGAFTFLGSVIADVIIPVFQSVANYVMNTLIPVFLEIASWVGDLIPLALDTLANFWTTVLQPPLEIIWGVITNQLVPAFTSLFNYLGEQGPTIVQFFSDMWTNTLYPAIQTVFAWLNETAFPILGELTTWLAEQLPPTIQMLADFWTTTLWPALQQVWMWVSETAFPIISELFTWLGETLPPTIQALADFWSNTLWPAIQAVWTWVDETAIPIIMTLYEWLSTNLPPAIETVTTVFNTFKAGLEAVGTVIDTVISTFGSLTETVASFILPDVLTPGSPTPMERGLAGIETSAKALPAAIKQFQDATRSGFTTVDDTLNRMNLTIENLITQILPETVRVFKDAAQVMRFSLEEIIEVLRVLDSSFQTVGRTIAQLPSVTTAAASAMTVGFGSVIPTLTGAGGLKPALELVVGAIQRAKTETQNFPRVPQSSVDSVNSLKSAWDRVKDSIDRATKSLEDYNREDDNRSVTLERSGRGVAARGITTSSVSQAVTNNFTYIYNNQTISVEVTNNTLGGGGEMQAAQLRSMLVDLLR